MPRRKSAMAAGPVPADDRYTSQPLGLSSSPSAYPIDYSTLAPENFTTLAHFSVSSTMSLPKSAGDPASGVPPISASRVPNLGSTSASLTALLTLSTISAGVALVAPRPYHWLDS